MRILCVCARALIYSLSGFRLRGIENTTFDLAAEEERFKEEVTKVCKIAMNELTHTHTHTHTVRTRDKV